MLLIQQYQQHSQFKLNLICASSCNMFSTVASSIERSLLFYIYGRYVCWLLLLSRQKLSIKRQLKSFWRQHINYLFECSGNFIKFNLCNFISLNVNVRLCVYCLISDTDRNLQKRYHSFQVPPHYEMCSEGLKWFFYVV
jgi:hypothetical protein